MRAMSPVASASLSSVSMSGLCLGAGDAAFDAADEDAAERRVVVDAQSLGEARQCDVEAAHENELDGLALGEMLAGLGEGCRRRADIDHDLTGEAQCGLLAGVETGSCVVSAIQRRDLRLGAA